MASSSSKDDSESSAADLRRFSLRDWIAGASLLVAILSSSATLYLSQRETSNDEKEKYASLVSLSYSQNRGQIERIQLANEGRKSITDVYLLLNSEGSGGRKRLYKVVLPRILPCTSYILPLSKIPKTHLEPGMHLASVSSLTFTDAAGAEWREPPDREAAEIRTSELGQFIDATVGSFVVLQKGIENCS